MPEAVQGASSRMASKGWPSHHLDGCTASAATHVRPQPEARQRLVDAFAPRRVDVQRGDLCIGKLQQVRRLAAGRGAGIEDRQRRAAIHALQQQRRGQLRRGVLHRHHAFIKARDFVHRTGRARIDAVLACRRRVDARLRPAGDRYSPR